MRQGNQIEAEKRRDGESDIPVRNPVQTDMLSVKFTIGNATITIRPDER